MGRFLAMLHSFMALQTGITWMEPNDRLDRFDKNLWLIGVACLHYLHEMVDAELTQMNDLRCVKQGFPRLKRVFELQWLVQTRESQKFSKTGQIREFFPHLHNSLISKIFTKFQQKLRNFYKKQLFSQIITPDKHKLSITLL